MSLKTCVSLKNISRIFYMLLLQYFSLAENTIISGLSPSVLVISLDGFSQSYLQKFHLPNIKKIFQDGSHPKIFQNQYPTNTLPNHFSMATGLYVESHGVVGSPLYDVQLDQMLNGTHEELYLQNKLVKPIWVVNEDHGGVSACLMWPGCGIAYHNSSETYHVPFNSSVTFLDLIDTALTLLSPTMFRKLDLKNQKTRISKTALVESGPPDHVNSSDVGGISNGNVPSSTEVPINSEKSVNSSTPSEPEKSKANLAIQSLASKDQNKSKPANLVMLYYFQPDAIGHMYGTESDELKGILQQIDEEIGYLMGQMKALQLTDQVNLILLSDHGMIDVPPSNVIDLKSFVDPSYYTSSGSSPLLHIYTQPGKSYTVFEKLQNASKNNAFSVIIKENMPESLHYKNNSRVSDLMLQADPGYVFDDFKHDHMDFRTDVNESRPFGSHGYDLAVCPEMAPLMVAVGPSFRSNLLVPSCSNVDIFPLLCTLLSLPTPHNNGSLESLELMLRTPPTLYLLYRTFLVLVCVVGLMLLGIGLYCKLRQPRVQHHRLRTDPQSLIGGSDHRPAVARYSRPSAIMLSEDELEEEEKLLSSADVWEV